MTGIENTTEETNDFSLELFTIPDESAFIPPADFKEDEKEEEEDENKTEEVETTEEKEDAVEEASEEQTQDDEIEESDIDKTLSQLLDKGILLLPDDYEYEDSKEGLEKAFEDSEKYRNQIAFQEAIKYLTSKDGLNITKVKESVEKIESYNSIDTEKLDEDGKLDIVRNFYKTKEYDEQDIDGIIEDLIGNDTKLDRELNVALKYLKKEEEKSLEVQAREIETKKAEQDKVFKDSQNLLKTKLQTTSDFNGWVIKEANKDRIFNGTYKPIKLEDGRVTTEVNAKLEQVLNDPDKYLVLADLLLNNMDDKGFNFSNLQKKAETEAITKIKKSIRDFKNTNTKSKVSGRNSQSTNDFDLSKASLTFG